MVRKSEGIGVMEKGIWLGMGLTFEDVPMLIAKGFSVIRVGTAGGANGQLERALYARRYGAKKIIADVARSDWREVVDLVDAEYYYYDEPYEYNVPQSELIHRIHYIERVRPNSKFVIGCLRKVQYDTYTPLKKLYYTFSSYTNNVYIPFIGKAIPAGFGDQSPSIRRIHKKADGRVPWIWVYGKNKILCHPDEFHKLKKTGDDLGIDLMVLYLGGATSGKYGLNAVSRETTLEYIDHFLADEKPYTLGEWWKREIYRWKQSFSVLWNKGWSDFIETLF